MAIKNLEELAPAIDKIDAGVVELAKQNTALTTQVTDLKAKAETLQTTVTKQADQLTALEKQLLAQRVSIPGLEDEAKNFKFTNVFRGIALGDWGKGFEKRILDEARGTVLRALGTTVDGSGSFWIPEEILSAIFSDLLFNKMVLKQLGASTITGLSGPSAMGGLGGTVTVNWLNEGGVPTESTLSATRRMLRPRELAAFVKIQNQLLARNTVGLEQRVRNNMAQAIALKFELGALVGKGSEYEPLGLLNQPGVTVMTPATNGEALTFIMVPDFEEKLEDNKLPLDGAGWLFHHAVKKRLKKERIAQFSGDTGGAPYILPMTDQNVRDLLGYNFQTTGQLPKNLVQGSYSTATPAYFGQWSHLWLAEFGMMEIRASKEASDSAGNSAFLQDQTWYVAKMAVDSNIDRDEAFIVKKDCFTT